MSKRQISLINDWTENAEEVPLDDKEAAALWQSLLADIYQDKIDVQEKIAVIKQLSPSDAKLILTNSDNPERPRPELRSQFERLASLGVFARYAAVDDILSVKFRVIGLYLILFLSLALFLPDMMPIMFRIGHSDSNLRSDEFISVFRVMFWLCFFMLFIRASLRIIPKLGTYEFTRLGHSIYDSALRFYANRPVPDTSEHADLGTGTPENSVAKPTRKRGTKQKPLSNE